MITTLFLLFILWVALGMFLADKLIDKLGWRFESFIWSFGVIWTCLPLTVAYDVVFK